MTNIQVYANQRRPIEEIPISSPFDELRKYGDKGISIKLKLIANRN